MLLTSNFRDALHLIVSQYFMEKYGVTVDCVTALCWGTWCTLFEATVIRESFALLLLPSVTALNEQDLFNHKHFESLST